MVAGRQAVRRRCPEGHFLGQSGLEGLTRGCHDGYKRHQSMLDPRTHQDAEPDREAPAPPAEATAEHAPAPLAPGAAQVLSMQRGAGNAAVTRMLQSNARPRVARLISGSPSELTDTTGAATTSTAAPTIADAANHTGPVPAAGGASVAEMRVRPRATQAAPFVGPAASEADLYEIQTTSVDALTDAAFSPVTELQGTPAAPVVEEVADNSLWIDPGPKAQDVQQMGIGDCYALSTIIAVVNRDPGWVSRSMAGDGSGGASVTLYRRLIPPGLGFLLPAVPTYIPETIAVNQDLAFNRIAPGGARRPRMVGGVQHGFSLHGAQLIAGTDAHERKWWTEVVGRTLVVHRQDVYQMARWAPLLEKAIARFSEVHGQYGHGGMMNDGEQQGPSGYANIDGGWSGSTLTMFYGEAGERQAGGDGDEIPTGWGANQTGTQLLLANQAAFDRLLTLQGRGAGHEAGDTTAPIVTATTGVGDPGIDMYATRLQSALPAAVADADWASLSPAAQTAVTTALTQANTYMASANNPNPAPATPVPGTKAAAFPAFQTACQQATVDPTIRDGARSQRIKDALDLLLVIKNMPRDTGGGTRSVYANHVYAVLSVNVTGQGMASQLNLLPAFMRPMLYSQVDVNASTVTLQNPHHTNAPDTTGASPSATGVFTLPLASFFMLYGSVMSNELTIPAY
jgi:hypothetical protein